MRVSVLLFENLLSLVFDRCVCMCEYSLCCTFVFCFRAPSGMICRTQYAMIIRALAKKRTTIQPQFYGDVLLTASFITSFKIMVLQLKVPFCVFLCNITTTTLATTKTILIFLSRSVSLYLPLTFINSSKLLCKLLSLFSFLY